MSTEERYRKGSLFTPARSDRPNAILGPNRSNPASAYRHGYFEAAHALLRAASTNRAPPDTVLYPIVYLFRHAVELSLKQIAGDMSAVAGRSPPKTNHHRIADLWSLLKREADEWLSEKRISVGGYDLPQPGEIDDLVADLATVDPDGVPFRFATDLDGNDVHPPISSVDFEALDRGMSRAESVLRACMSLLNDEARFVRERRAERARQGS